MNREVNVKGGQEPPSLDAAAFNPAAEIIALPDAIKMAIGDLVYRLDGAGCICAPSIKKLARHHGFSGDDNELNEKLSPYFEFDQARRGVNLGHLPKSAFTIKLASLMRIDLKAFNGLEKGNLSGFKRNEIERRLLDRIKKNFRSSGQVDPLAWAKSVRLKVVDEQEFCSFVNVKKAK